MKIEYERAVDDIIAFNLFHLAHSPSMKRQLWAMQILTALICLVGGLAVFYFFERGLLFWTYIVSALMAVAGFFIYPPVHRWFIVSAVRKTLGEGDNKAILGKQTLALSPEGIFGASAAGEEKLLWSVVNKVMQSDAYIFVYISSVNAVVIPKKAFASKQEQQAFLGYIASQRAPKKESR